MTTAAPVEPDQAERGTARPMPLAAGFIELAFSLGHALSGSLPRTLGWLGGMAVVLLASMWTAWAIVGFIILRVASAIHAGVAGRRGPVGGRWHWLMALATFGGAVLMVIVLRLWCVESMMVPSAGMSPTLQVGDYFSVNKLARLWRTPGRGDVIVYRRAGQQFVSRVVATGGESVAVRDRVLYIDGQAMAQEDRGRSSYWDRGPDGIWQRQQVDLAIEDLAGHRHRIHHALPGWSEHDYPEDRGACTTRAMPGTLPLEPTGDGACRVPAGGLFVMGDNRWNSNDSRQFGAIRTGDVTGYVVGVWWGKARLSSIRGID